MSLAGRRLWRLSGIMPAFFVLVSFGLIHAPAQVKTPKRVTSVRAAKAPDGSKVTVVSNSALNDYEAYRRGDRFYVKVPQAGLGATRPRLRGEGFEDVDVQKTGDDLIFSFRLKQGTAARVNQNQNRLEVVFAKSPTLPSAAVPQPSTSPAPNTAADIANLPPPPTAQASRSSRVASDVREKTGSINAEQNGGTTNSSPSTGVLSALPPANPPASTNSSTSPGSQPTASGPGLFARWSVRKSLLVLVGLLVLCGVGLLLRSRNRRDKGWHSPELSINRTMLNDGVTDPSPAASAAWIPEPGSVPLSSPDNSLPSSESIEDLAEKEASLLRQELALRREADALEAKQLAAEKARKEFEASAELRAELTTPEDSSSQVTLAPEVVARLQEENRYRMGAETLRKAAEEFARMRHAAEAVRKAAEQKATPTAEEKTLDGMANLEIYAKKTASN